jgi:hypothetical protein
VCGPVSESVEDSLDSLSNVLIASCTERFRDQFEFLARLNDILNLPQPTPQTPDEVVEALLNKLDQQELLLRWKQLSQAEIL